MSSYRNQRQTDREIAGCLFAAIWGVVVVFNLAFLGVIIWAIIALVTHFT